MYLTTYKKLRIIRIIAFTLVYIIYTSINVAYNGGIKIVSDLMLASAVINAVFSLTAIFIDDDDKTKTIKKHKKVITRTIKLIANLLKLFILIGSLIFYYSDQSLDNLYWTIAIICISVANILLDLLKNLILSTATDLKINSSNMFERIKRVFNCSKVWKKITLNNKKCYFKIGEEAPFYTRLVLRKLSPQDLTIVNYKGKLIFYENKDNIYMLGSPEEYPKDYDYILSHTPEISTDAIDA